MDQNRKEKIKQFFKKEGFYVVLFLCLCIVAVVATVATRNNDSEVDKKAGEFTLDISDKNDSSKSTSNTADKSTNGTSIENNKNEAQEEVNEEKDVETSGTVEQMYLYYPVEGTLSRAYQEPIISEAGDEARTNSSIHIRASEGAQVRAAGKGIVEEVAQSSGEKGAYVKIKHTDGRTTVYSNLNPEILVNKGDEVDNTTVIGTVGSSSKLYSNTEYKNDLEFELYRADGTVMDPTIIFPYEK